jgi:hypothetical protein
LTFVQNFIHSRWSAARKLALPDGAIDKCWETPSHKQCCSTVSSHGECLADRGLFPSWIQSVPGLHLPSQYSQIERRAHARKKPDPGYPARPLLRGHPARALSSPINQQGTQRGRAPTQRGTAILAVRTGGTPVPRNLRGPRRFRGIVVQRAASPDFSSSPEGRGFTGCGKTLSSCHSGRGFHDPAARHCA